MAYYAPNAEGRFAAALIPNRHVDGTNGSSLAVWTGQGEGKARTRIRAMMMRERAAMTEVSAPNGGTTFVLPLRFANQGFWQDFLDNPHRDGLSIDLNDGQRVQEALSRFSAVSGFEVKEPELVGRNRYGFAVYDRTLGRTAHKIGDHRQIIPEWQRKEGKVYGIEHPEMFFRARNDFDLSENARSVFIDMVNGQPYSHEDVARLATALSTADFQVSPRDLMEHVEGEVSRCVAGGEIEGRQAITALMQTFPRQRERNASTILDQQYSTPYPFGLSAAQVFGPMTGKTVLEPTIGNAALIASIAADGAEVTGFELDHGRFLRATRALGDMGAVIEPGDFLGAVKSIDRESFDVVIANPPFDTLPAKADVSITGGSSTFSTDKLHYAIAAEAMERLKPGGSAFFVLPANFVNPEEKNGPAQRFHNLLKLSFDHVEEAVADGRMYAGMGTNVPVQIYAAHGFREELHPFAKLNDPAFTGSPRMLATYADLFEWTDDTRSRFGLAALGEPVPVVAPVEPQTPAEAGTGTAPAEPSPAPEPPAEPSSAPGAPSGSKSGSAPRSGKGGKAAPSSPAEPSPAPQEPETPAPPATQPPSAPGVRSAPIIEDDPLPGWLIDTIGGDDTTPYRPFSAAGSPSSVVPKSLSGAIYQALGNLEKRIKQENGPEFDIDDYVSSFLKIPKDELLKGERLSPEQIDGIALCLDGIDQGHGVLVGDLMGMGKGRELAALFEASMRAGDPVMFVTVKPSLFSDFLVRDLADLTLRSTEERLENGEINLHLVNSGEVLMDREEKVIFKQPGRVRGQSGYPIAPTVNAVATTYSQFQKADTGALRLSAVKEWMEGHFAEGRKPRLILDEAHKAASPDSNTGAYFTELCRFVEEKGGAVIWSSATGIKTGEHINLYYSALPDTGLGKGELLEIMSSTDALSLQEALSHEMTASGAMFVRQLADQGIERDLPRLVDFDPDKIKRVRDKVNNATETLRDVIEFMPVVKEIAGEIARKQFGGSVLRNGQDKLKLATNSPVSNLHHFSGYLTLATKGQFLQELVTDSLARGEKQVFTIEHVGNSILEWKMAHPGEMKEDQQGRYFDSAPNLGDVLKRYVEKAMQIRAIDALGNEIEISLHDQLRDWVEGMHRQIDGADLEDMRIDGADLIKVRLDQMGLSCGELTGRTSGGGFGVTGEVDGKFYLYELEKGGPEAGQNIANRFNDGELDALVLNKASSAGISIQNAPSVARDLRRRAMFKMELQADIVDERQIEGRVDRKGQLEGPRYVAPLTGFASDDRLASLFNRKNRSLSASTNATRENATNIDEVVDLLNPIGREIVFRYLSDHRDLAASLDIEVGKEMADGDALTRKLLGRLIVRPLDEQTRILGEIDVSYRMRADFLDRRGLNPLKNNRRDWRGKVVDEEILLAENRASGFAAQPVRLTTIEAPTVVTPLSFSAVEKAVRRGLVDSRVSGNAADKLDLAFANLSSPKFEARPWLRTVSNMDRSLFASGETRDNSKMAQELGNFFQSNWRQPFSKMKTDADRAKMEVLRNAQFLYRSSRTLDVGQAVFVNASLIPEAADTRMAQAVGKSAANDVFLPAIVTAYSASGHHPLDPLYHSVELAIPGEAAPTKVRLGNVAQHLRQTVAPDNWADPDLFVDADHWLRNTRDRGLAAEIESWLVDHAANDGMFERASYSDTPASGDREKMVSQRPELRELFEGLFDRTVAGSVMEEKTVLTGNMFRALVLTRQKNGQSAGSKIMFSDDRNVWHHGIEVSGGPKNERLNRIRDKAQVTAISSPNVKTATQLDQAFRLVMEQDAMQPIQARVRRGFGELPSPMDRVAEIYAPLGEHHLEDKLRAEGLTPAHSMILAPTAAFVGPDVFSDSLLEAKNGIYRGLNKSAGVRYSPVSASSEADRVGMGMFSYSGKDLQNALASSYKDFKKGDLYYFQSVGAACLVFDPRNQVLQDEFPDLVEMGSNKALRINGNRFSTTAGMLAIEVNWQYDDQEQGHLSAHDESVHRRICEALVRVGEVTSQPILMTGMMRSFVERMDASYFEMEREQAPEVEIRNEHQIQEVTTQRRHHAVPKLG